LHAAFIPFGEIVAVQLPADPVNGKNNSSLGKKKETSDSLYIFFFKLKINTRALVLLNSNLLRIVKLPLIICIYQNSMARLLKYPLLNHKMSRPHLIVQVKNKKTLIWEDLELIYIYIYKVWTEESWLQKYAKTEEDKDKQETKQSDDEQDDENDESETQTYQPKAKGGRTRVYMDIQIGGSLAGRIEMEVKEWL
jgi:peptidyl-prolyl isomerase E (cyclophilin E)